MLKVGKSVMTLVAVKVVHWVMTKAVWWVA
jgi:hypothetical protein